MNTTRKLIRRIIRWLLFIVIVLYLITGFGITEFRAVETTTFGLLTKSLSFQIHNNLWLPFLFLLTAHLLFSPILSLWQKAKGKPAHRLSQQDSIDSELANSDLNEDK